MNTSTLRLALAFLPLLGACADRATPAETSSRPDLAQEAPPVTETQDSASDAGKPDAADHETELATFGAGCFWCTEAVLEQLDGVLAVRSGYTGGDVPDPSYKAVCAGTTGHAEAVEVEFDPERISYDTLLAWFWQLHDPTTLNRQGADVGTQYRSAIFFHSEAQREAALASKARAQAEFDDPIVTEITEAGPFYEAEEYHQDYYRSNKSQGYCRAVIAPKLDKLGLEK